VSPESPIEDHLQTLLTRLADRDRVRSEATIQADVRNLLLTGGFGLGEHDLTVDLEVPVGDRRRIDIEAGCTVIEVKRDLRSKTVRESAEKQLAGYVRTRTEETGQWYVGVLTDGAEWRAYHLQGEKLVEATRYELKPGRIDTSATLSWLEGVLATRMGVKPTPAEISRQLGAASSSYALDRAVLGVMYAQYGDLPTVRLKRELWAKLLRSALGTQFTDDDELFLEHTLLVNSAEIIAHLVLGLDVTDMHPASLLSGRQFDLAYIFGVVEEDFFDWVLEVPGGDSFIRTMARRLSRFDWANVEHDVLKVLYEEVITSETRKKLGEYYTPDWLAERMVAEVVTDPLHQRVLDPSCGSGTFLFHAVRRYLDAAEEAGIPLDSALNDLSGHVLGIDLHPVAVALARVTYLLAIGRERLTDPTRGPITVPVYLGDSLQWSQRNDLFSEGFLVIPTGSGNQLFEQELRFPDHLMADAGRFDRLVEELTNLAGNKNRAKGTVPSLKGIFRRYAIDSGDQEVIKESFAVLCRLFDEGRNHIWSYYIRNLVRPVWLKRDENRVDVLIGNPPWLAYRHMPDYMQETFKEMSKARGLWRGNTVATHQDLSGLFVARAVQQYLKVDGSFAFVLPNPVLDRGYFSGFRAGKYIGKAEEPATVAFSGSWDLRRIRPHLFPRGSAVVFGKRTRGETRTLPDETIRWTGTIPRSAHSWADVAPHLTQEPARLVIRNDDEGPSPYGPRFVQGATIVPRVLFFVQPQPSSPLGFGAGRRAVRSERSSTEKPPWKNLPDLTGVVESEFVRPVLLGESVLPYRILPPREAVLPLVGHQLIDESASDLDLYPGMADWWQNAQSQWEAHRSSARLSLLERLDFRRGLSEQLPGAELRVVYGKAGMHVAAALVEDRNAIIDHKLYWGAVKSRDEAMYLCAILNSPVLTELVRPLMSYGKDERDVDKHLWKLPIPLYDSSNPVHNRLAELGAAEADLIKQLEIDEQGNFVVLRRRVREALAAGPYAQEIEELVSELIGE